MSVYSPDYQQLSAYALGYYEGRALGTDDGNPYDYDDPLRQFYIDGYNAGIGDYCREDESEEPTEILRRFK